MDPFLKEVFAVFGASAFGFLTAGWLVKTVVLEAIKRESERNLKRLEQEGALHLERAKQQLEIEKQFLTGLRTEFMAEQAINRLLSHHGWEKRTFEAIKSRIGGFEDDELRQLLVRSGAVKFRRRSDGAELWGLLSRNQIPVIE